MKVTTTTLVTRYNKAAAALGRKPVNKFSSRAVAEKRVAAIEGELQPKKRAYDADSLGEKRGLRFDLPGGKNEVAPREGTSRAKLLDMLKAAGAKGIDFEDLHKACGFKNRKSTRDAIGLLSRKNGYAISGSDASVRLAK
jgi:hypothetical protein